MRRKYQPMQFRCSPHPSGRPRHDTRPVGRGIWRQPDEGFVTPRLQRKALEPAIGFVHHFDASDRAGE